MKMRLWVFTLLAALLGCASAPRPARASSATFQSYGIDQGLSSLGGDCLVQDPAGYLLVCTENGVSAYDGRRFSTLGAEQGLRSGGDVYDIVITQSGRVAVAFADDILVSARETGGLQAPTSLVFQSVRHPGVSFFSERLHRIAGWQSGLVLLTEDATERVVLDGPGPPHLETMPYDPAERRLLQGAAAVFAVRDQLWETFDDGRLCAATPGHAKCYAAADGLPAGPWVDVIAGEGLKILARSATSVASFDPGSGRWSAVELPDQGGRYGGYVANLGLFRAPDGSLVTQANHGLAILSSSGWRALSVAQGAPAGTIVSAMTDATGQFWFQMFGHGLVRWIGYGRWESFEKSDGLSDGIAWQTARHAGGPLWISTDTGIDEVVRQAGALKVARVYPGPTFAIATGPRGELWHGAGHDGARVIDPLTGAVTKVDAPAIDSILPGLGDIIWLGTRAGLYEVDARPGVKLHATLVGSPRAEIVDLVNDGAGGLYYISNGRLRHRRADGDDSALVETWPVSGFEPIVLALDHDANIWVGGGGGLYRCGLVADRVSSCQLIPIADIRANSVVALMVDRRGWVWAGTSLGVSVFDGQRWVSVDADSGLVASDVDQGGIREDPDGSIWINTDSGVSHLLEPTELFAEHPIAVVVSRATIGTQQIVGDVPYTKDALAVQFGTPNYGVERSLVFRYHLSGVDGATVESASGIARYPFVPPGHHVLTVTGYDEMTHRSSPPVSLEVNVGYPWWRQWWAETLWACTALALVAGAIRLRDRMMLARQAELRRHVAAATEQLRYDGLTGLLNRREIEKTLAERLCSGSAGEELVVALLDVDHFKRVNDNYGHLAGDDVLRGLGRMVAKDIWQGECAGRYGGEEILLILDDSDGRAAERVLHLLHAVRGTPFKAGDRSIRVTCSIGLAWAVSGDGWESLIGRADDALYEAKAAGRDQVVERARGMPVVRTATGARRSGAAG